MAVRSREYVGIAEGIKSHEISTKRRIENLNNTINELSSYKNSLEWEISSLEAQIYAAESRTDEEGNPDPDYGLIAQLESQKRQVESDLKKTEDDLDKAHGELREATDEFEQVMEEKERTLFEIQERARNTSANISKAGGMVGAYSGVGTNLQSAFQASFDSLSQAANILDGSVGGVGGGYGGRGSASGGRSNGGSGSSGYNDTSTSPLSAFMKNANGDGSYVPSPSDFHSEQSGRLTPATSNNFNYGNGNFRSAKAVNYCSSQSENSYANSSFLSVSSENAQSSNKKYQSEQKSTNGGAFAEKQVAYYEPISQKDIEYYEENTSITPIEDYSRERDYSYEEIVDIYDNDSGFINENVQKYTEKYAQTGIREINWGPDTIGEKDPVTVKVGTILNCWSKPDRIGKGHYFAYDKTDYDNLSLPESKDKRTLKKYIVLKSFDGIESVIAKQPWEDKKASKTTKQIVSEKTIDELIKEGYIMEYFDPGEYYYEKGNKNSKHAYGQLKYVEKKDRVRNTKSQVEIGFMRRRDSDDGGHLIASRFGGSPNDNNLFPQDFHLNRSQYKRLENEWERLLNKEHCKVFVDINVSASNNDMREDSIYGSYTVIKPNGEHYTEHFSFANEDAKTQQTWENELYKHDIFEVSNKQIEKSFDSTNNKSDTFSSQLSKMVKDSESRTTSSSSAQHISVKFEDLSKLVKEVPTEVQHPQRTSESDDNEQGPIVREIGYER